MRHPGHNATADPANQPDPPVPRNVPDIPDSRISRPPQPHDTRLPLSVFRNF